MSGKLRLYTILLCAAGLWPARPGFGQGDGTFRSPVLIRLPSSATWVAAGDFDRDGKLDLAATQGSDLISIVLQDRVDRERWGRPTTIDVGQSSYFLRAADFDADGDDDLAVADPNGGFILRCRGDGRFEPPRILNEARGARWLVVEDLDADGDLDLAFACHVDRNIATFFGAGDGSFTFWEFNTPGGEPHTIDSVDADADGLPDLLVGADIPGIQLLRNRRGGFDVEAVRPGLGTCFRSMAVGDFDGDGAGDVATACGAAVNLKNGDFERVLELPVPPRLDVEGIAVGDLDGDSLSDLAYRPVVGEWSVLVHLSRGKQGFLPAREFGTTGSGGGAASSLLIRDLDGDGRGDLAFTAAGSENLSVFWGAREGLLDAGRVVSELWPVKDLEIADLDGDRSPELVVPQSAASRVKTYPLEAAAPRLEIPTIKVFSSLEIVDLDGDGSPDLAGTNSSAGVALVEILDGQGKVRSEAALPAGNFPALVRAGRLDAGESVDLVALCTGSSELAVFLGQGGGTFGAAKLIATIPLPRNAALGDLDGDGLLDAVTCTTDQVGIHFGDGAGGFGPPVSLDKDSKKKYVEVAVADVDGSGIQDILALETRVTRGIAFFLGKGGRKLEASAGQGTGVELVSFLAADLNGDGRLDLSGSSTLDRSVSVFLQQGALAFSTPSVYRVGSPVLGHRLFDVDSDGVTDIVAFSSGEAVIMPGRPGTARAIFRRGDVDGDGTALLNDAVLVLGRLFLGGDPLACEDAADADDDGALGVTDAVRVLFYLFLAGEPPPAPGPLTCGEDTTADALGPCAMGCRP